MTKTTVPSPTTCFWPSRTPSQNSLAPVTPPKTPDVDEPDGPQKDPVVGPVDGVDPEVIEKERGLMTSLLTDLGWLANYNCI